MIPKTGAAIHVKVIVLSGVSVGPIFVFFVSFVVIGSLELIRFWTHPRAGEHFLNTRTLSAAEFILKIVGIQFAFGFSVATLGFRRDVLTKIKAVSTLRKAWMGAKTTQNEHVTAARTARSEFRSLLKSIDDRRAAIQLAADAEWPSTDAANSGIRAEFALPPKRPFTV